MAERLWAPWRMQYILGADKRRDRCVLCDEANPATASAKRVLGRRATSYVILNVYPYAAGHLMVVPTRHVSSLVELPGDEHDALFRLVRDAIARLEAAVNAQGVNVGVNLGIAAGAGLAEHVHVHVVPRWVGDSSFMAVLADVRTLPEYLDQTYDRLLPSFGDLDRAHP
jgi:ATP adenylyltransferase